MSSLDRMFRSTVHIPVHDLQSDRMKCSGIICYVEAKKFAAVYHSVLYMVQTVISFLLSFSPCHLVACRDRSGNFLEVEFHQRQ